MTDLVFFFRLKLSKGSLKWRIVENWVISKAAVPFFLETDPSSDRALDFFDNISFLGEHKIAGELSFPLFQRYSPHQIQNFLDIFFVCGPRA